MYEKKIIPPKKKIIFADYVFPIFVFDFETILITLTIVYEFKIDLGTFFNTQLFHGLQIYIYFQPFIEKFTWQSLLRTKAD